MNPGEAPQGNQRASLWLPIASSFPVSKPSPGDSRMEQDHHTAAKSPFHRMGARWRRVVDCQRLQKRKRLVARAENRFQAFNSQAREACTPGTPHAHTNSSLARYARHWEAGANFHCSSEIHEPSNREPGR